MADWPVEWWGGWLGLHRDSVAVTPSHHCQMSSVYKTGQLCNDKGWCETETHSILNVYYMHMVIYLWTCLHSFTWQGVVEVQTFHMHSVNPLEIITENAPKKYVYLTVQQNLHKMNMGILNLWLPVKS